MTPNQTSTHRETSAAAAPLGARAAADPLAFLSGGGEAERMIRARDWTGHPLGSPETWPAELRAALSLVLNSPESMILAWGPELSFFFNETYFPLLGPRLPWAMGERFDRVWADAWDQAKPIIDEAFAGRSRHFDDLPWKLGTDRGARDTWWSFSYSRVLDGAGEVAGLFIFTNETTARVLAEQGRRSDERRNRQILDSAADYAIVATDTEGLVTRWNEGARRVLGWSEEEMLGQTADRFFTPEDRANGRITVEMQGALAEGRASDERWHLRRDGTRFWASGEMQPLRDEAGEHLGFTKVLRDRTRERLDQQRLEQAEARYRLTLAASGNIGWYDWDVQADRLTSNELFAESFGLDPERGPEGAPIGEYLAGIEPADVARVEAELQRAVSTLEGVFASEYRTIGRDGTRRWVLSRGRFYFDKQHNPVRLAGTVVDITERKAAEEALAASSTLLRRAQEAGGVGLFTVDVASNTLQPTPEFCRLYGLPVRDAYPAATIEERLLPEDAHLASNRTSRARGELVADVEYRIRRADDARVRWIARRAEFVRDEAGHVMSMIGTVQDVTDRRRLQDQQGALLLLGNRLRDENTVEAMTLAAAAALGRTLDVELVGYGDVDPVRETITVERDWTAGGAASLAGTLQFRDFGSYIDDLKHGRTVIVTDCRTDPRTRGHAAALEERSARAFVNTPVVERGVFVGLLYVSTGQAREWKDDELAFIRDVASLVRLAVTRVRAEQQQHLLNEELAHRLKNTLAVVQAMAAQTLRAVPDQGPVEAFAQRVGALGAAHDILLRRSWGAAPLRSAVATPLGTLGLLPRCDLDGPDIDLGPKATMSLSLLVHELATNAVKYGALSNETGRVAVRWRTDASIGAEQLVLDWVESGGPPAREPTRRGFGSRLVRSGLIGMGGVELQYLPEGLRAHMTAPLGSLGQA